MSDPVLATEYQPGDLVFLESDCGALDWLVTELDRSKFAHVGIVVERGIMASARLNDFSLPDADMGGVRLNALDDLALKRAMWFADPPSNFDRGKALDWVRKRLEFQGTHHSGFSFVKLFVVSAALLAQGGEVDEEGSRAILAASVAAAKAWDWQKQRKEARGFYCAELVAAAYDIPFDAKCLTPPDSYELPKCSGPPPNVEGDVGEWIKMFWRLLKEVPDKDQRKAVARLFATVWHYDESFVRKIVPALMEFLGKKSEKGSGKPDLPAPYPPGKGRIPDGPLLTALVSPRMISQWAINLRPYGGG